MGFIKKGKEKGSLVVKINLAALEHVNKGMNAARQGRIEEAVLEFKTALKIEPETSDAYFGLGMVYQQKGLLEEALSYYKKSIESDPTNTDAMFNIGSINMFREDFNAAIEMFQLLSKITPEDPQVFLNLGSSFLSLGQLDDAITSLEEALHLDPGYSKAQILLIQAKQQSQ